MVIVDRRRQARNKARREHHAQRVVDGGFGPEVGVAATDGVDRAVLIGAHGVGPCGRGGIGEACVGNARTGDHLLLIQVPQRRRPHVTRGRGAEAHIVIHRPFQADLVGVGREGGRHGSGEGQTVGRIGRIAIGAVQRDQLGERQVLQQRHVQFDIAFGDIFRAQAARLDFLEPGQIAGGIAADLVAGRGIAEAGRCPAVP